MLDLDLSGSSETLTGDPETSLCPLSPYPLLPLGCPLAHAELLRDLILVGRGLPLDVALHGAQSVSRPARGAMAWKDGVWRASSMAAMPGSVNVGLAAERSMSRNFGHICRRSDSSMSPPPWPLLGIWRRV